MFRMGLVEEVRNLLKNLELSSTAAQAIGYKEIIAALNENLPMEQANEEVKRATRRYAKRQLTHGSEGTRRSFGSIEICKNIRTYYTLRQNIFGCQVKILKYRWKTLCRKIKIRSCRYAEKL